MSAPRQFQRPRILAQPGPGRSRRASGRYRDQSSGAHECRAVAAYLAPFRTPGDRATPPAQVLRCKREPEAVAARRRAAPSGRASRPSDGTVSHLGAFYALACLSSGEPGNGRAGGHQRVHRLEQESHGQIRLPVPPVADVGRPRPPGEREDEARFGRRPAPFRGAPSLRVSERRSPYISVAGAAPHRSLRALRARLLRAQAILHESLSLHDEVVVPVNEPLDVAPEVLPVGVPPERLRGTWSGGAAPGMLDGGTPPGTGPVRRTGTVLEGTGPWSHPACSQKQGGPGLPADMPASADRGIAFRAWLNSGTFPLVRVPAKVAD